MSGGLKRIDKAFSTRFDKARARSKGYLDEYNPASYKRFSSHPRTPQASILFRGDTRSPDMIKRAGGFYPQPGKHNVSESGGSTAMVCLTLSPNVAATYYAYVDVYFKNPPWGANKPYGYVYAVYLDSGMGIQNHVMAANVGSKNVGSREVSALIVPWDRIIGWRQLLSPKECQPRGGTRHDVPWHGDFQTNEECKVNYRANATDDERAEFAKFSEEGSLVIYRNDAL